MRSLRYTEHMIDDALPPTPEQLQVILKHLSRTFNGFSGNCGSVAEVINEVLDGEDDYLLVDGGHYQYVDHILVKWGELYWDMEGGHTQEAVAARWIEEGEDGSVEEARLATTAGLCDPNGIFAGGYDEAAFRTALRTHLNALPELPAPVRKKVMSP